MKKRLLIILCIVSIASAGIKPFRGVHAIDKAIPIARGLVAYWSFNENTGSIVNDISDNRHNGTINTPVWIGSPYGSAIDVPVAGNIVVVPKTTTLLDFGTGQYSIVAWIEVVDNSSAKGILGWDTYDPGYALNTSEQMYIYDGGSKTASTVALTPGWHQVAFVRYNTGTNGTSYYSDGKLDATTTHADSVTLDTSLQIGCNDNAGVYELEGGISQVMIFNRALAASEIAFLYSNPHCLFSDDEVYLWQSGASSPAETHSSGPAIIIP